MKTAHEAIAEIRAEIGRRLKVTESHKGEAVVDGARQELFWMRSLLDTLETEEKDVDLEKEIQEHIKECLDVKFPTTDIELIKKDVAYTAKRFYELGFNARKEVQK